MLGYFGVRFLGQGVLTSASRNVLLLWFNKRRGLVSSIRGIFVSFGFSLAPLLLAWMISGAGWRLALWQLAFACAIFSIFAFLLLRDNPAACGVEVDGASDRTRDESGAIIVSITLEQARTTQLFWVISLSLSIHALFATAVTFHIVSIFAEAGRGANEAFAYFLPVAIVSTTSNLIAGWMADKHKLKPFLVIMILAFLVGAGGLLSLDQQWGYAFLVLGFGVGSGLWSVISNLAFIRNFGPLHLGEISGLCTSVMVFASAIGPALFGLGLDYLGSYAAAEWLCVVFLLVLLAMAIAVPHSER
jgi:cyanate permease